jgi:predicted transcriptional regulator
MPRRLKLSPLQRDIFMMLEEAGAETVATIIATVKPSTEQLTLQVDQLVSPGLIHKDGNSLVLTKQGRIALTT